MCSIRLRFDSFTAEKSLLWRKALSYFLIGICSVVIIILLACILRYNEKRKYEALKKESEKNLQPVKCPVCSSELFVGEQLISKVYRPMKVPDQLMTISGCPHCYPACEPGVSRICPVCHQRLSADQNLTARLFNKQLGKKHVHIVGCSNCHKPRSE